jgi:nuclear transport factor 2 (NTF2) superfamily protein
MNNAPFDRDDQRRENERIWDRRDAVERAIRFGDDAVSRAQADFVALRQAKAEAEARKHYKPKEGTL